MGACLSTPPPRTLTPVTDGEAWSSLEQASGGQKKKNATDSQPSLLPPSISFITVYAKGWVTPSTAPTPAALAALAGIPERDIRILLPPDPPIQTPSGALLAGPSILARRGRAWAVGLEGVRGVVCEDRILLLVGPALGGSGALDSGGRPPEVDDEFVRRLARVRGRAATTQQPSFEATALDAMCEAVVRALEVRAAALLADAGVAADALVASATGRGGGGGGGGGWSAWCCCVAPTPQPNHPSGAAARLRRVKGEVSDLEASARRVMAALGDQRRRRRRTRGGGSGDDDGVAAVLSAAAARAGAAAGCGNRAASSARAAETAARMALRRRALACGGA